MNSWLNRIEPHLSIRGPLGDHAGQTFDLERLPVFFFRKESLGALKMRGFGTIVNPYPNFNPFGKPDEICTSPPSRKKLKSLSNQSKVIQPLPAALAPFAHLKIRGIFSMWRVPLADTTALARSRSDVLSGSSLTGWSSRLENRVPPLHCIPLLTIIITFPIYFFIAV